MTSMFLGFISARPTEVVSIVNLAKPLMYASLSSYMRGKNRETQPFENNLCSAHYVVIGEEVSVLHVAAISYCNK